MFPSFPLISIDLDPCKAHSLHIEMPPVCRNLLDSRWRACGHFLWSPESMPNSSIYRPVFAFKKNYSVNNSGSCEFFLAAQQLVASSWPYAGLAVAIANVLTTEIQREGWCRGIGTHSQQPVSQSPIKLEQGNWVEKVSAGSHVNERWWWKADGSQVQCFGFWRGFHHYMICQILGTSNGIEWSINQLISPSLLSLYGTGPGNRPWSNYRDRLHCLWRNWKVLGSDCRDTIVIINKYSLIETLGLIFILMVEGFGRCIAYIAVSWQPNHFRGSRINKASIWECGQAVEKFDVHLSSVSYVAENLLYPRNVWRTLRAKFVSFQ